MIAHYTSARRVLYKARRCVCARVYFIRVEILKKYCSILSTKNQIYLVMRTQSETKVALETN